MSWTFVFVNSEAKAELDALSADVRASFERIVKLVQAFGLERVHEPYIKPMRAPSGRCGCGVGIESPGRSISPPAVGGSSFCECS
jgi:hypothetical protein